MLCCISANNFNQYFKNDFKKNSKHLVLKCKDVLTLSKCRERMDSLMIMIFKSSCSLSHRTPIVGFMILGSVCFFCVFCTLEKLDGNCHVINLC